MDPKAERFIIQQLLEDEDDMMELATIQLLAGFPNAKVSKTPCRTSNLSGRMWVKELLAGNETRIIENLGIRKLPFKALCNLIVERGLWDFEPQQNVDVVESLAMFLYCVSGSNHHTEVAERFQHSTETVYRHVSKTSRILVRLAPDIIRAHDWENVHSKISNDKRHYPWFKDCIGAIDGTNISAWATGEPKEKFRCRKNTISQNVLAGVDHDMRFIFVYTGWERSAHDGRVFRDAISRHNDRFPWPPPGKFYVVDAGYANQPGFLAPYKGEDYHRSHFAGRRSFLGPRELFNHRHSSVRNIIECTFGVLKKRFPLLKSDMPPYKLARQCNILIACCVVHNFIRENDLEDTVFREAENTATSTTKDLDDINWAMADGTVYTPYVSTDELRRWSNFRDAIAADM